MVFYHVRDMGGIMIYIMVGGGWGGGLTPLSFRPCATTSAIGVTCLKRKFEGFLRPGFPMLHCVTTQDHYCRQGDQRKIQDFLFYTFIQNKYEYD